MTDKEVWVYWVCNGCEVGGGDPKPLDGSEITCWFCDGPVIVTAQPTLPKGVKAA